MNNADPYSVSQAAMTVLDRLQNFPPAEQIMGAAAMFLILAEHRGIPAQDVFTATKNLINGVDGIRPEFRAVAEYCKHELPNA
jgi:hypothetical protein